MFTVHCPEHGTEVLLPEGRIDEIVPLPDGHLLRWRCWCGHCGTTSVARRTATRAAGMAARHRPAV